MTFPAIRLTPDHRRSFFRRTCLLAFGLTFAAGSAWAQDASKQPIKLIVPFPAGGSVDLIARIVAQKTGENLNQTIVIENRGGSGGNIGAQAAAQAVPNGLTLFFGTAGTHGINPSLYKKLPYDPVKDFAPVIALTSSANVLVVNPGIGVKKLADLVAKAKAAPGALNMGSGGNGTTPHLSGVMLNNMAGIQTTHIPYKVGPIIEVIAGRLDYSFESVPSALPHILAGKVIPIGVTSNTRVAQLKDVPTIAESGYPHYQVMAWTAFFAPAGTPPTAVQRIHDATEKALKDPATIERLAQAAAAPLGGTSEELRVRVRDEIARWPALVKESGASVD